VAKANWVEVSLTVSAEQAEAIVEVLSRTIPNGVVVEQKAMQNNPEETNRVEPDARVFGYLLADATLEDKKQQLEEALWHLGQIQPLPAAIYQPIQDEDWMAAWKKHYQPIKIGKKLVIVPAWIKKDFPGRLPIYINPGMAFGTGTHPSTQLCLQLLEEAIQPAQSVIDVGCGSGILSIAALRLGAGLVLCVDIDHASVISTLENAANNQLESRMEVGLGSVNEIHSNQFKIRSAPLVVVNILASIIIQLFEDGLADLVEKGGKLILAGILEPQAQNVIMAANKKGLVLEKTITSSDWTALLLKKIN
jgi:ribosomal protein L11 methyltransferase